MYTSGSTGRPKGVMVSHASVCNHLFWRQQNIALREQDCQLQKASFSFDVSVWEIFEPLVTGARLVLARSDQQHDSAYIADLICRHQVTAVSFVPSLLRGFLQEPKVEACTTLRRVNVGGEVLSVELQEQFFSRLNATLYFGYGPTEATIAVICWTCRPGYAEGVIPIGRPISNTEVYILDEHLQPVPVGVPGELHIGGDCLARDYWNRPELSAEKFIPNPFTRRPGTRLYKTGDLARYRADGNIEFLGRRDQQVKLRGMRIELGEIEATLAEHPGVHQTAVILREDAPDDKRLVAYVVPTADRALSSDELRTDLRSRLPGYMIPSAFVILPGLPLTPTGKLDRNALPIPSSDQDAEKCYVAPATTIEKQIAEIWEQVLGCERISIHDSFFDLGGHSLLAGQVVSRISKVFQVELPMRTLFDFTTVAELAIAVLGLLLETEEVEGLWPQEPGPT
jgi:acyl-coenzyme A synthetase/AMP-(fatty) acid ligase/acyl carrier protein